MQTVFVGKLGLFSLSANPDYLDEYACGIHDPHYPMPAVMELNPLYVNWVCRDILKWVWSFPALS